MGEPWPLAIASLSVCFFFTADELGLDGNRLTGTIATEFGHLERLSTSCGGGGGTAMRPFANLDS